MAVPTITSVTPATGPVGGSNFVVVVGTGFQVPPAVPVSGPTSPQPPTVRAKFDTEVSARVDVISATEMHVTVPPWRGAVPNDALATAIPPVALTVENIDSMGVLVPGETVTAPAAYTYIRPDLRAPAIAQPWARVTAELVLLLRRQVLPNVSHTTHVDYSNPGEAVIAVSKLPALIVEGPRITRDAERWDNETIDTVVGDVESRRQPPYIGKLQYTVIGASDGALELLNIEASIIECFERIKFLEPDVDPADPSLGRLRLFLQLTQPPQTVAVPSDSNVRVFTFECEVRGVAVAFDDAYESGKTIDDTEQQVQQFDPEDPFAVVVVETITS
jgi:hypothetical protein